MTVYISDDGSIQYSDPAGALEAFVIPDAIILSSAVCLRFALWLVNNAGELVEQSPPSDRPYRAALVQRAVNWLLCRA